MVREVVKRGGGVKRVGGSGEGGSKEGRWGEEGRR